MPVERRNVTPLIQFIRDVCRGRKVVMAHRWTDCQAKRTQPPPKIPGGPYDKTSQIYYYPRDARREVQPPLLISKLSKQIEAKESVADKNYITPGKTYNWSS
ncbi:hypothetical protein PUN28_002453 [Cardiocondyla obscurior]|uniref:NADH dehydrogenase [ubiquinone] 1 alpha subcomplex subunit 7 n=1 Tax=Cardiocondyla obscurior TaxID=286306 RepID=A0AAW2GU78_9HYME